MGADDSPKQGRTYGGQTAEERAAERRGRLVAAGRALFGTAGIRGTRVADVCAAAKLTERYFYESFANLEELGVAVVEAVREEAVARVLAAVADEDSRSRARASLQAFVDVVTDDPTIGRLLMVETVGNGEALATLRHEIIAGAAGLVHLWLQGPDPDDAGGPEADAATRITSIALAGATTELIVSWLEGRLDVPPAQIAERLVQLFDAATSTRSTT
jgi:AcrR family transcriptional regulator